MEELIREEMLIGKDAVEKLQSARVAVFGIGGVGGYVVEALARCGVGGFLLVDSDVVSRSNLNRQIIALQSSIGKYKTQVMRERIYDINPQAVVDTREVFYLPETADGFDFTKFDYIVDAVDTVTAKIEIAVRATAAGVPVISCMGTGNKLDPTLFRVEDIYKTSECPLARVMRRELKKRGVPALKVVYSTEKVVASTEGAPASIAFVPSVAGLVLAGEVVKDLIGYKR